MADPDLSQSDPTESPRPMKTAVWRGWRCKCPNCGDGPMLRAYIKVRDECPECGEQLYHHRADDGPPYLTLLIVGHLIAPLMIWVFNAYEPSPYVFMAIFMTAAVVLSLFFLPRLKGVLIAIQWATRMYGFGRGAPQSDLSQ